MRTSNLSTPAAGPLSGVRVIDFSSFIAGSFAAMLLGDLGAEVIKVEPLTGDLARAWAPFLKGESRFYQSWNRNKRGIAVDLSKQPGREIAHELAQRADIAIENFRHGVAARLGIDYEALRKVNPRIIYCSSTAFGSRGPYRDRPGYDPVLQTLSGAARGNARHNGGRTAISVVPFIDYQASTLITTGVLAALYHRERTGVGQKIETSLLQAMMTAGAHYFIEPLDCVEEGGIGIFPYRMFETADEMIFIAGATDKFWRLLCDGIGAADLGRDPKYSTNALRVEHAAELTVKLESYFRARTALEWESILNQAGVPCASPRTWQQFFSDPQVEAMDMNPIVEHPSIGRMRVTGVPLNFDQTPGAIQSAAPRLGEHTDEILRGIGYDEAKIAGLRTAGIISPGRPG
jgi:crotonobetainyl-CoA:carnitine CoA-transferase CaiB-like acyl-CoA transferase